MSDQEDTTFFDSYLTNKYGIGDQSAASDAQRFDLRLRTAQDQFNSTSLGQLDKGSLYVDPRSATGYKLTGDVEEQSIVSGVFGALIGDTDNSYQENIDANAELTRSLMSRGLYGATNRARFIRKAQSEIGMAQIMGILGQDDALNPHIDAFMNGGYSTYGAIQFARGFAGALDLGYADMTGDAKRGFEEVDGLIRKRAERMMGDQFRLERPIRDENGEIRLDADGKPKTEVVMDSFDPDKFYEYLNEHETFGPMLKDARIDRDDLNGLRNIGDALESLSYKLFEGGQQKRAEATIQQGFLGTLSTVEGFTGMIAQDPDIGVEIGTELGLSLGLSLVSGGASLLAGGGRIGLKISNLAKKAYDVNRLSKVRAGGTAERAMSFTSRRLENVSNIAQALNVFRPGTTTGGNVAAFIARKYGTNAGIREGAFIAGQLVDGAIGGGGAMISNNLFLADEQLRLHGDTSIRWNDHLGLGIGMGMAGATVLGYGMRALGLSGVSKRFSEAYAKSEADLSQRIYGNPDHAVQGAAFSLKTKFTRMVNEIDYMLQSRGIEMRAPEFMQRAGFNEGNTNLSALHAALKRQVGDELGNPKSASELLARVAKDSEFIADNIGGKNLTAKQAESIGEMHAQAAASASKKSGGPDTELQARIAEAPEGKTEAQVREELKTERIAKAEEKISKAKQQKVENSKKLSQDKAARKDLETKGEEIVAKADEQGQQRFNKKEREATKQEFEEAQAEAARLDAEIATSSLRDQDLDAQIAAHEARIDEIGEGLYGGAGGKDSTEFDLVQGQYVAVREAEEQINIFAEIQGNVTPEGKLSEGFVVANKLETSDPKVAAENMFANVQGKIAKEAADPNFPTKAAMTTGESRGKVANHVKKMQVAVEIAKADPSLAIYGKELISDPATYTAPRVLTEAQAQAKTAELRKGAKEPNKANRAAKQNKDSLRRLTKTVGKDASDSNLVQAVFNPQRRIDVETPEVKKLREAGEAELKARGIEIREDATGQTYDIGRTDVEVSNWETSPAARKAIDEARAKGLDDPETVDVITKTFEAGYNKNGKLAKSAKVAAKTFLVSDLEPHGLTVTQKTIEFDGETVTTRSQGNVAEAFKKYNESQPALKSQADVDTDDIRALNEFLFNLQSVAYGPTVRSATDDYGFVSEHALLAAAKDTGLIVRSDDGTVQGLDFRNFFASQLKDPDAPTRMYNVQGIADVVKDLTDFSGRGRLENDAASVRRAQASDIAASRAKRAGPAAQKFAEANPETPFAGKHTAESYRATIVDSLVQIYKLAEESGQGWVSVRSKINQSKNSNKPAALKQEMEAILTKLDEQGLNVESLGNGVLDFQNPHAVARALYDLEQGRIDGDTKVKKSRFDEGSSTFKEESTARSQTLSGIQPAHDVEIAKVFDKLEYRHRLRAVYEMDFGQNGAPTFDEMLTFLRSGALKTSMGRAMDPERLTLASQIVPPQMRAGDSLSGGIDKYLDDVVTSMLELPPTYLDMIHDDFGTLPRLMMQSLDSMEKNGEGWFGQVSMAGGFPFATPRMTAEGRPSMPMNAVHAAGLLFRGSWGDMLAADAAGQAAIAKSVDDFADLKGKALSDAAKEAGIQLSKDGKKLKVSELRQALADKANESGSVFAIRNVDGSQNGVRWSIAAQENARTNGEIKIFERIEERLNSLKDDGKGNLELGRTGKVDFYLMVADATQAFIQSNPDKVSPELSLLTSRLGIFDKNSPNYKIGRKATKNPVMTLPYGAGKASVRGAFENFLRSTEVEIDGKSMTIASYLKDTAPTADINKMAKDMANIWYGQKNKQGQNLIEKGLKLLPTEEVNSIIAGNAQMRSELSLGKLNPKKSLNDMALMAKRMAEEGLVENETHAFMALQARAHANSMLQVAADPKHTALMTSYRKAKSGKMAIIAKRDGEVQNLKGKQKNEVYEKYDARIKQAEKAEAEILDLLQVQLAYRQEGLDTAAKAADVDLRGNMRQDPMILEVVERLSNKQLAKEMKLVYKTFDEDPAVAAQAMKDLGEAVRNQELPFFDRATKALNRTVFTVPDNGKIKLQQMQTGIDSAPFLPKEADGIFQQTLNDHRGRVVTPQTLHAAFKAKKSQRGLMDLHAIMEEADMVSFKTSKAEAEADFKNQVLAGKMDDEEWIAKHLDPEGTFGIGYWDFMDTGDLSLRDSISRDVRNGTDVAVAGQVHRATKGLSPDNEHVIKLANWDSIDRTTPGGQKELIDALVGANTQRIKQLGVKNVLAMASAYGSPPVVKDADGAVGYLPSRTSDELYGDWAAASAKVNDARTRALDGGIDFDKLSPEAQAAYRKSNGDPFKAAQTYGIVDEAGLARTIEYEAESKALAERAKKGEDTPELYFADKMQGGIMHGLEIHPTEHMNAMLGIPALREHAFKAKDEGLTAVHARNMNEGRGVIAPEYKNTEHGVAFDGLANRGVTALNSEAIRGMRTDMADQTIAKFLGDHAKKYGLEGKSEVEIYQHRLVQENFMAFRKDMDTLQRQLDDPKNKSIDAQKAIKTKMRANQQRLIRALQETDQDVQTYLREAWDTAALVPAGAAGGTYRYNVNKGILGSLEDSAMLSARTDDPKVAAERTNMYLTGRLGGTESTSMAVDLGVPGARPTGTDSVAFFARGTEVDTQGNVVTLKDAMDNRNAAVSHTHNTDSSHVFLTAGMMAGESLLGGMRTVGKGVDIEDISALYAVSPLLGHQGSVSFRDAVGRQIVNPEVVGRNARRIHGRDEVAYLLNNSTNRYVGEALELSASTAGPDGKGPVVRQRRSMASLMDDRLAKNNRNVMMEIAEEQSLITSYLQRKYPDQMGKDSFSGRAFLPKSLSEEPEILSSVFRTLAEDRRTGVLNKLELIDPALAGAFRLDRNTSPSLKDGLKTLYPFERGLPTKRTFTDGVMDEAIEAWGLFGMSGRPDSLAARMTYDAAQQAKLNAVLARFDLEGGTSIKNTKGYDAYQRALEKHLTDNEIEVAGYRDDGVPIAKTVDDLSEDALEALALLRKQDNYLKNLGGDFATGALMDGYSSTMLKFMFDATDLTPSRMEIRKLVLANEPLTPKQKEEVFDFLTSHDHSQIGTSSNKYTAEYGEPIVDTAVAAAKKAYEASAESGPEVSYGYRGDFVDHTGKPQPPEYFQNASKYRALSSAHKSLDEQFENLIEAGVLNVPQVRLLRSATAAIDPKVLDGIKMDFVASTSGKARQGKITTTKFQQTITLLKDRLGDDFSAVDVVMHEIGHASYNRMLRDKSSLVAQLAADANTPQAKSAMREIVSGMYGGETKQARKAMEAMGVASQKQDTDVEEFAAQWFSYVMQQEAFGNPTTIQAAYKGLDKAKKGLGATLKQMVEAMVSYGIRRFKRMSSLFKRVDPSTAERMNTYVDVMRGKTDLAPAEHLYPSTRYYGGDNPFEGITGKVDAEDAAPADKGKRIYDFDRGVKENDPVAMKVFMEEILPYLDSGRKPEFDFEAKAMADELGWSMGEKHAVAAMGQDFMMPFAKTNHTFKSNVSVKYGDARYAIMPLLADLLDSHTSGNTQATFNGRPFRSLTQVAREAESRTVGRMTELSEDLRVAMNKDENKLGLLKEFESQDAKLAREDMARTAVLLLAPTDSAAYAKGKAKFDKAGPETQKVLTKMSNKFKEVSAETKRNAVQSGMMTNTRAVQSGLVPIMLRQEHMADKGPWAGALREEYQAQLIAKVDEVQDVDGLIAVGLLPSVNKSRKSFNEFEKGVMNLVNEGILDRSIMKAEVEFDGSPARPESTTKRLLISVLANHHRGSKSTDVAKFQNYLGPRGRAKFDKYKSALEDPTSVDRQFIDYMANRREDVRERTAPRHGEKVSSRTDNGIADLRQFTLNRKIGSAAYYYGGDKFISNHDFFLKFGDEFIEADPTMLTASIHRGIGLDAMDAKNLSEIVPGVKGITTRNLLDLAEKLSPENSNSPIKDSLISGVNQLRAAREQLGGGRPAQEMTGSAFHDFMNRHSNSATMVLFGGNMGLAMMAETASVAVLKAAPMFVANPVRTVSRILESMTAAMSPMRKAELLKHASYAMHEMRGQHSVSTIAGSIDRTTDASLGAAGQQTNRVIDGLGTLAYRFGGGSTVQAFNKDLAMRLHIDSLYDKTKAIRKLKDGMAAAELNGLGQNKESFVKLAREAGFGGDWHLASRLLRSQVTDNLDDILELANITGTSKDRTFDFDAIDRWIAEGGSSRREQYGPARAALWNFLDDSVSRFMVEPRVLDMNLTENRAWNRFMDIFLSWPRAFAGQKGLGSSKGGREGIGMGHLVGFATAQVIWDSIYTTVQEVARGEDPNKIRQQVEQDPVGWFMQKATRLPMTGALGSQVGSVAVDYIRNMAAKMTDGDVGYLGSNSYGIDFTGSPAGGALKSTINAMGAGVSLMEDLALGTMSQQSAMRDFGQIMKLVPLFNSLYAKSLGQMLMNGDEKLSTHKPLAHYEAQYRKKILQMQQERLAR